MARTGLVVGVLLLSGLAMSGVANGAFYFDIWPPTADGQQNTYPEEGYAIQGEGSFRFTKSFHHYCFLGFNGKSDGPDGIPEGRQKGGVNDSADGILMADWLVGKKAFHAAVYVRNSGAQTCNPSAPDGAFLADPVVIIGFRVANDGVFVDRGVDATGAPMTSGYGGCCADYTNALLDGGENAPGAWRIGRSPYSQQGDIGSADAVLTPEWYKISAVDTLHAQQEVYVGSAGFGTAGFGGNSTDVPGMGGASSRWAFDYVLQKSDAMMINSASMGEADCTGYAGEEEPRDFAGDLNFGEGWFAEVVDRCIIQAMVTPNDTTGIIECKGLVFSSATSVVGLDLNASIFSRDQSGGGYEPYLAITATLAGDGPNNDGCVDVVDLLDLVGAFGSMVGDANFQPEVDWNCDGFVDVVDLLTLVETFGLCIE